jgi:hypothetical protein
VRGNGMPAGTLFFPGEAGRGIASGRTLTFAVTPMPVDLLSPLAPVDVDADNDVVGTPLGGMFLLVGTKLGKAGLSFTRSRATGGRVTADRGALVGGTEGFAADTTRGFGVIFGTSGFLGGANGIEEGPATLLGTPSGLDAVTASLGLGIGGFEGSTSFETGGFVGFAVV